MRRGFVLTLTGAAILAVVMIWQAPATATPPSMQEAEAGCASADQPLLDDTAQGQICPITFCSSQPGKRCNIVTAVPCSQGGCRYMKVNDPNCTTPGTPPLCPKGCS